MTTAKASPAKRFFVEMLTRDIELQDAILDLLDNCVDGAMRQNKNKEVDPKKPYLGYKAWIDFDGISFTLRDNCGGIPLSVAENYAFRMGRQDLNRDPDIATVGVYGIGMKRAIFKMGRTAKVTSHTENSSFEVSISSKWLEDDDSWDLPIDDIEGTAEDYGTTIEVTSLKEGISRLLSNDTDFEKDLEKAISAYYGYIIEKGFEVILNQKTVVPLQISLILDQNAFSEKGEFMAPYAFKVEAEGVAVELAVGMYREIPTDSEEDDALAGKPSTERAGWTIICNDRVVMYADKSRITGWGEAGVPGYHTQFVSIAGVVIFRSADPSKLPITTTKRGIDGNSELYLGIKEHMREGLKLFTDFTNKWKRASQERSSLQKASTVAHAGSVANIVPAGNWTKVSKGMGGARYKPNLPLPKDSDPMHQIRFSRKRSDIRKVSEYMFEDPDRTVSEVGAECFDYFLRKAS